MSWTDKIKKFANSPSGKELLRRGQRELSKPQNQEKLRALVNKLGSKKR